MLFEWDKKKAQSNLKKHRVSFVEAQEVFSDPYARVIDDPDHSYDEERFIIVGISSSLRVLVVAHCYRQGGDSIRIISARKATTREEEQYWRF